MLEPFVVKVVNASDVFFGHHSAWEAFSVSDPDCTWGDNNRSLVSRDFLTKCLEEIDADDEETKGAIAAVVKELEALADDVYIDLEN